MRHNAYVNTILLTKTTAAQTEDALNYRVSGLYFLAVVFVATITKNPISNMSLNQKSKIKPLENE